MNKRILELADQAGFIRFSPEEDPHTPIDWSSDYSLELEKFAELIVQECIDIVECYKIPVGNSRAGEIACDLTYSALGDIRDQIKELM